MRYVNHNKMIKGSGPPQSPPESSEWNYWDKTNHKMYEAQNGQWVLVGFEALPEGAWTV